jgi:hypothetical protein
MTKDKALSLLMAVSADCRDGNYSENTVVGLLMHLRSEPDGVAAKPLERIAAALERIADNTAPASREIGSNVYTATIAESLASIDRCMPEPR